MPIAQAKYVETSNPWEQRIICAHCGTPVFAWYASGFTSQFTWHHNYLDQFHGQMTCDPQLARAAKQGRLTNA